MEARLFGKFVLLQVVVWSLLCCCEVTVSSAAGQELPVVSGENFYSLVDNGSTGSPGDQLTGGINGRITDSATGAPVVNMPVFAKQTDSFSVQLVGDSSRGLSKIKIFNTETYQAVTTDNGTYALEELPTGVYSVWAYEENGPYLENSYKDPHDQAAAKLLFVQGGSVVDQINFSLQEGASVAGKVMSNFNGQGVGSALVTVLNSKNKKPISSAYSDSDGNYVVQGVPDGSYIVKVESDLFVDSYYGGNQKPESAVAISIKNRESIADVDFLLKRSAEITGTIKDIDNQGLINIKVTVFDYEGQTLAGKPLKAVWTDQNGMFAIDKLPPGSYALKAEASSVYLPAHYDTEEQVEGPTSLNLGDGQILAGIDVTLAVGGVIKGQIVDEATGNPVQKVEVKVLGAVTGERSGKASTDNNGEYFIDRLPPGSYIIQTNSKSYASKYFDNTTAAETATVVNITTGSLVDNVNFTLVEERPIRYTGSISGNIIWGYDQSAVKGGCIKASTISPNKLISKGCSDADGHYKVTDLPNSDYRLFVEKIFEYIPEFYSDIDIKNPDDATPVSVINGGQVEGINFVLAKVGSVTGTIFRDTDEQELASYEIIAAPGTYRIKVTSEGSGYYSSEEEGAEKVVTILDGQTTPAINLALSVEGFLLGIK